MRALRSVGRFCYDFVIGDDWKIAVAVVITLVLGAGIAAVALLTPATLGPVLAVLLFAAFTTSMVVDVRRR